MFEELQFLKPKYIKYINTSKGVAKAVLIHQQKHFFLALDQV